MKLSFYSWRLRLLLAALNLLALCGACRTSRAKDAADAFFDIRSVQTVYLEIKDGDLQKLQAALPERISVPGVFRWNDQRMERIAIRYKGNSSSMPNAQHKRSFLISFAEVDKDRRFLGLRHVALDNGIQFGSLFSEPLITETLRALGAPASRCNYARVYLNNRYIGVYVNVERIDRSFLQSNFATEKGYLFKVDQGGPGSDLHYLGDDPSLYKKTFALHAGREKEAFAGLVELIRTVNAPSSEQTELSKKFDLDAFVTTTAVLLFAGAFDQYTGWGPHNYYLYQNPANHRWSYIPWDLDVGFADHAFGRVPVLEGWNAAWPAPIPGRPLMERLLSDTNLLRQYRQRAGMILEKYFRPEVLIPKLRDLYRLIKADLEKDPFAPRRVTVPSDSSYEDIITSMESFIGKRYALARGQLDHPGNRPEPNPMEGPHDHDEPMPGSASADAPTDLRALKVTHSMVELRWNPHARGEAASIVQRCETGGEARFANAIGQPGQNISTAIDQNVQPGKSYRYRVYAIMATPAGPRGTGVSNEIVVEIPER